MSDPCSQLRELGEMSATLQAVVKMQESTQKTVEKISETMQLVSNQTARISHLERNGEHVQKQLDNLFERVREAEAARAPEEAICRLHGRIDNVKAETAREFESVHRSVTHLSLTVGNWRRILRCKYLWALIGVLTLLVLANTLCGAIHYPDFYARALKLWVGN